MDNTNERIDRPATRFHRLAPIPITELFTNADIHVLNRPKRSFYEHVGRPLTSRDTCETPRKVVLEAHFYKELPQIQITANQFREQINSVNSLLKSLNRRAMALKKERMNGHPQDDSSPMTKLETLCNVKTQSGIFNLLTTGLRAPSVEEIIDMAIRENVKDLVHGKTNKHDLMTDFYYANDYENNPWSDFNLYRWYETQFGYHSYLLAVGLLEFQLKCVEVGKGAVLGANATHVSKQQTDPYTIHRKKTEHYERDNCLKEWKNVAEDEIIVTMSFYHSVRGHKIKEYDVLATQTLFDVYKQFQCSSELVLAEGSLDVRGSIFMFNGMLFPNTQEGACDYSRNILHFFAKYKPNLLKTTNLQSQQTTTFEDFEFVINQPGFLLHIGDCEHRAVITSMRKFTKKRDCPYVDCYPLCTHTPTRRYTRCQLCVAEDIEYTYFNSLLFGLNPINLCLKCYNIAKNIKLNKGVYHSRDLTAACAIKYIED